MAWNISKAKRQALVKLQLRDRNGRFIEMGGGVKWYSSKLGREVSGTVVDYDAQRALIQLNDKNGKPTADQPFWMKATDLDVVEQKASLDAPSAEDTPEFEKPEAVGKVAHSNFPFEGSKLSEVSAADMAKMEKGTILRAPGAVGTHFLKQDGDSWKQVLSNGDDSGNISTSAAIKNHDGFQEYDFAKKGSDPWATSQQDKTTVPAAPGHPNDALSDEELKQKYALPEDTFKPYLGVSKTSDGNTYITAPEGTELYTPAKELAIGDEVIAPDGAHPQKPFSMGKGWAYKSAERVNTQGPKIGKVLSIKEHAYAVVQLPEGETVESTQKPGEQVNTVTIGLSNKVIKATPELKESLKDVIPEPTYAAPEAPATSVEDEKKAKRLDMLKKAPAGSSVKAKDGSVEFHKDDQGNWNTGDGTSTTPEEIEALVSEKNKTMPEGSGSAFVIDMVTATDPNAVAGPAPEKSYLELAGPDFAAKLSEEPTFKYGLKNKDEEYGGFDAYNPAERAALEDYVGSSVMANSALRLGGNVSSGTAQTIAGMDSIMERSALTGEAKVYRGVGANQAMLEGILAKGVMRDRAFTSTSVDKDFADSWVANTGSGGITPVVMEITLPKGFKAHKVDYDAVGPGFDHENEVVLPRDLAFDITGVEEYTNASGQKGYRVQATPILNEKNYDQTIGASNDEGSTADPAGAEGSAPAETPAGDGQQQVGEVYDNAGTGGDGDAGGSGDASPAEPSPEATGTDSIDNGASGPVAESVGLRRNRETIMAELQPMDTSAWKKVGGQAGSNPGGVFEDENGQKWYVKQSKSEDHARAEVLSDQLYKAAGIDASGLKLTTFNGKMGTASPMIDGAKNDLTAKLKDSSYLNKVREGFAVDAWLANWDVLGLEDDNIVTDSSGNPVRIDTGGTMMFRAQGGLKNAQQPGAWGNDVKDWDGLRKFGTAQKAYKDITDQQLVESAARVEAVTPEEIDAMVDALGYKEPNASELKNTLKARRDDIIAKAAALTPSQKDEPFEPVLPSSQKTSSPEAREGVSDAPASDPFEPVLPSSKLKFPKATKENPNVLQGYTIEQNENGVYFPKERLDMAAWHGLQKGTIVPPNLPFIPFNTASGEVHYWDSKGNRHWGQFGGSGALTRRKNDDGQFEYLLAQRASSLSTAPNMWSTPGGAHATKEDSQTPGATAKNELSEELGMDLSGNPIANYKHATAPDWAYEYSIFDAPEGVEPDAFDVDSREIQAIQWMTADEIKGLKDDGTLHPAMAEVLDDLLKASESVETGATVPETSNEDSNAPEAPSQAAETAPDAPLTDTEIAAKVEDAVKYADGADPADVQAAKDALTKLLKGNQDSGEQDSSPVVDDSATESMPTVQTDGPSATMADGKTAYVGSRVTHDTFGHGTVVQIIAGKSAKIEFDDGITKISQAHKINSHDKGAVKNSPADTSGMVPGEYANNPASGKLFIVGSDNSAIYQGDKVEAMHQGEMRSGVVKGIYKSNNSVAIIFDGESKPSTKKASTVNSLESAPDAPATDAPSTDAPSSDAPKYDADGYTPEEAAKVAKLEEELAGAFKGTNNGDIDRIEAQLDELYAKGEARLAGNDTPEAAPEAPADVVDAPAVDEPVAALESDTVSEPEAAAPAADENPLDDNFEKLPGLTDYHKGDVAVLKNGKLAQWVGKGKLTLEDGSQINGNKFSVDGKDIVIAGKDIKAVYRPKKMVMASSSTHPFGEGFYGYSFDLSKPNNDNFKPGDHIVYGKENNEGKIMSVNPTNILVQKLNSDKNVPGTPTIVAGQIHGVYRKDGSATPTKDVSDAPEAAQTEDIAPAPEAEVTAPESVNAPEEPSVVDAPESPAVAESLDYTAENVPAGSYMPIGDSPSSFVKDENGEWEMFINDYPTGVKVTDEHVQTIADNTNGKFKVPTHLRESEPVSSEPSEADKLQQATEALQALQEKIAKDLAEVDAKAKAAEEDAKAESNAPSGYTEPEGLADWEKELLNGGSDSSDDGMVSLDNLSDEQKKALGFETTGGTASPEQPLNPEYISSEGTKFYKPPTMPQDEWDGLADWEKELLGHMVKPTPVNNYNSTQGVELIAPSGAVLDDLNLGAKLVNSDKNEDVWTKVQDGPTGYGDGLWEDQTGAQASSEELANGADVKVMSFGNTPKDNADAAHLAKLKEDVTALPIGSLLGDPEWDNFKKIDDDLWYAYNGTSETDEPAMSDEEVAGFANAYDDFKPSLAKLPSEPAQQTPLSKVSAYPVGTTIGETDAGVYFVKEGEDFWKPKHTASGNLQTPQDATWVPTHSDQQIAALTEASDEYSFDTVKEPSAPDTTTPAATGTVSDVANLPIGAKLGQPDSQQWEKTAPNKWEDWFNGEHMGLSEYTDAEVAELVDGTQIFKMDSLVLPEGATAPTEEKTDIGSLGGMDKADFQKIGVGTKVVYSANGKASQPTGTYEKVSANEWNYTPEGAESPSKTGIKSDTFDHLFEAGVDNSKFSINNKRTKEAEHAEPEDTSGVTKGVKIYSDGTLLESYPVGTTLKPEIESNYYYPNNTYYVKQADGTWQQYKKTNKKTMKGDFHSSAGLSYQISNATVSEPISDEHMVLSTGEIAYVGDKVLSGGEEFTVKSITKTGINVVDSTGVKKLMKPHALQKDTEFGKPQGNGSASIGGLDPLTESSNVFKKAQQKKLEIKLAAEKALKDIENFSGASADDYNAAGVKMPSNPTPTTDNGVKAVESGPVDTSNPLYNTPKPTAPPSASNYPAFQPPATPELPKWDSADWLEKVKQRYLDNPNKAKATLEDSAKWHQVQQALNGDKNILDSLESSMYLTPELKKEALDLIEAQESKNAPLIAAAAEEVKKAKDEYDALKADHISKIDVLKKEYQTKLEDWMKANPGGNGQFLKAKKPPVSTESFKGGEANWEQAHEGTFALKTVMDAMKSDNVLGLHGLSVATDSDQIEDLDVKVTKVLDKTGVQKFEMKFKLTAPYGDAMVQTLSTDPSVTANNSGIYPTHMVKDAATGLLKDAGKPISKFVNDGTRYEWTDKMTGAKIVFQRTAQSSAINISANNNTVRIHMPVDSTPEQYQQTLENLGIKNAKPSTDGDIKVLAENKLLSLMGEHTPGVKTYDGRVNMGGEDRKKALAKIAQEYGVTPEDMTFISEPNGRVRFELSEEKALEFAKKYKIDYFSHDVSDSHSADRWVNMIAGVNPGLLSTYHRFTEGVGGEGMSSATDMSYGSGDYVYITPKNSGGNSGAIANYSGVKVKATAILKRTDFWANPGDGFGTKANPHKGGSSKDAPYKLFDKKGTVGNNIHEVLPKDSVPVSDWAYAVIPSGTAQQVREMLTNMGITEINGMTLDEFILTPGSAVPQDFTPAAAV